MIFFMKNMFQDVQKDVHLFINMFVELMEGKIFLSNQHKKTPKSLFYF